MKIKQVILVSGLSGAGKSSVMSILEDLGYLCLDNFPLGLLDTLLTWIEKNNDARYYDLALSTSAADFSEAYKLLIKKQVKIKALFLDSEDNVLVQRYQFTRNRHPFIVSGQTTSLLGAIDMERRQLSGLSDDVIRIDTTHLNTKSLKVLVESTCQTEEERTHLSLSLISFGFRYGLPLDADMVFDVRFINNPYWQENLKKLTGNDQEVIDYVFADKRMDPLIKRITAYSDFALKEFINDQKGHVTLAIGCTGGKHRSVAIVNYLEDYYQGKYQVLKLHRDLGRK